jgi:purine-binding chemotaxis protein CheW
VSSDRLCTFAVGGLRLGIPVEDVVEVVRGEHVTPVPLAPAAVAGVLNLRGRIVPVLDARLRLGLPPRDPDEESAHVVLDVVGEHVSLVVDREGDVVQVHPQERQDVPETVDPRIRRLCTAAYQREDALLLVLDPRLVLALA